jgi:hypothetical protein
MKDHDRFQAPAQLPGLRVSAERIMWWLAPFRKERERMGHLARSKSWATRCLRLRQEKRQELQGSAPEFWGKFGGL